MSNAAGVPRPSGATLLESILFLMEPAQRTEFLSTAGAAGVVYANRAPAFQKPLAVRLSRAASDLLRAMVLDTLAPTPGVFYRRFRADRAEAQKRAARVDPDELFRQLHPQAADLAVQVDAIARLRSDLECGVRFSPPPRNWFQTRESARGMPVRVESRQFAVPCRLDRDRTTGDPFLLATAVVPPGEERGDFDTEPEEFAAEGPADLEEPADSDLPPDNPTVPPAETPFHPHVVTSWTVLASNAPAAAPVDQNALSALIRQVSTNRRYAGFMRGTRERCEGLMALVRLLTLANQFPFTATSRGEEVEVALETRHDALAKSKRVNVLVDVGEGKERRRLPGAMEVRGGSPLGLRRPAEGAGVDVPDAGFLMDSGLASQLGKQREALIRLAHCGGKAHLMRLASLLGSREEMRLDPNPWRGEQVDFRDGRLDESQREAVRKALSSPDVCLIQGPPGTGKTRVIAEIVRQGARRGWKTLLVAPSHVAVDNVLERIGLEDEVSPVRCVREERREKLPPDIREFTYENRARLLADDSREQVRRDLDHLRARRDALAAAVETVGRLRGLAEEHDREAGAAADLEHQLGRVDGSVADEFRAETEAVLGRLAEARRSAEECASAQAAAASRVQGYEQRLTDVPAGRLSGDDHRRLDAARRRVEEEFADRLAAAARATGEADRRLDAGRAAAAAAVAELDEVLGALAELDAGMVPAPVRSAVDGAVASVARSRSPRIRELDVQLTRLEAAAESHRRSLEAVRSRIRSLETAVAERREAGARPFYSRVLYGAWWGSLVRDYAAELAAERSRESELAPLLEKETGEAGAVRAELNEARAALAAEQHAVAARTREIEHENYRRRVPTLERARAGLEDEVRRHGESATEERGRWDALREQLEAAAQQAAAAETAAILREEGERLAGAIRRASEAVALADAARAHVSAHARLLASHEARVRDAAASRREHLRQRLDETRARMGGLRAAFEGSRASLADVLPRVPEMGPVPLDRAAALLAEQRSALDARLALVGQWDAHLAREAPAMRERLARYVNLVCSTTMGIATDDYFGDRGPFEEKEFDLLIVDEAGKVTELEFLVPGTRARRWVLVGDHKQLPPYYDRVLDPVVAQADAVRAEQGQPPLDADALRRSCFERLRERLMPSDGPLVEGAAGPDRCVTLTVQRRMHPDLAAFISDVFYQGEYRSPAAPDGGHDSAFVAEKTLAIEHFETPVTFVEVAPPRDRPDGLETDLEERPTGSHPLARWAEYLPDKGYANLEEANRAVSALRALVGMAPIRGEQRARDSAGKREPVVGVIAFYAGQVALIRQLILASDPLRTEADGEDLLCEGVRVTVNSVDAFQGKECPVVLVSFTRSNRRAAVGFVDDANRLNVALSRAQKKLILFGDSQTLTRRSRRKPTPSEQDSRSAAREREFFTKLIGYVADRGRHLKIFQLRT